MSGSINQNDTVTPLVLTDFSDYAPGSTAVITGAGFGNDDTVEFQISLVDPTTGALLPAPAGVASWTVTDDDTGAFSTSWYVDQAYANTTIQLTATDLVTGVTAIEVFTDHVLNQNNGGAGGSNSSNSGNGGSGSGGNSDPLPPVPSASAIDLTGPGASAYISGSQGGTAYFGQLEIDSGTGQFPSFLGVQATGQDTEEDGFNSAASPSQLFADTKAGEHTGAIQLSDLQALTYNGQQYRQILLAVNQQNTEPKITLNALQLWVSNAGDDSAQTDSNGNFTGIANATKVFDLGNNVVELTSQYSAGNGYSDYVILIPNEDFPAGGNPYVYLYADMGGYSGFAANGGFEEFGTGKGAAIGTGAQPGITIVKSSHVVNANSDHWTGDNGDIVNYTIEVTNTGNVALTGLSVVDPFSGGTLATGATLAVGQHLDYTTSYAISQADVDQDATITNTATVTTNQTGISVSNTTLDPVAYDPAVLIEKSITGWVDTNGDGLVDATDVINYSIAVTNTGDVTLQNVTVTDPTTGLSVDVGTLAANGGTQTVSTSYTIQQADVDTHGASFDGTADDVLTNTASVATDEGVGGSSSATQAIDYKPAVSIAKSVAGWVDTNGDGLVDATDVINYGIVVTNTGDVTLQNATVTDPKAGLSVDVGTLAANGGTQTVSASYTIQQADVDTHGASFDGTADDALTNTASVATDEGVGGSSSATQGIDYKPAVSIAKTAVVSDLNGDSATDAGDQINYTIAVKNTGDVTLTGVLVTDPLLVTLSAPGGDTNSNGKLDVGETWTYTGAYTITQADVDNNGHVAGTGLISNTASVTDAQNAAGNAQVSVAVQQNPGISIQKLVSVNQNGNWSAWSPGTPTAYQGTSPVRFEVIVKNTGNTTDHVSVSDVTASLGGFNGSFKFLGQTTIDLAPGASATSDLVQITASTATGTQTDTATVSGTYGSGAGSGTLTPVSVSAAYKIGTFTESTTGLSIGYWYNHQLGKATGGWGSLEKVQSGGVLLGSGKTLFVPDAAASELINASQSATDTRQILLSQALGAQLNVNNNDVLPGADSATVGADLIATAVKWLTGSPKFIYADGSTGNTDSNGNGTVDSASTGTAPSIDFNTKTAGFTFEKGLVTQLTSNTNAWQSFVDTGVSAGTLGYDYFVSGQGLKNALQAFDQNQLQTSNNDQITWAGSSLVYQNDAAGMWASLSGHVAGVQIQHV